MLASSRARVTQVLNSAQDSGPLPLLPDVKAGTDIPRVVRFREWTSSTPQRDN